MNIRKAVTIAGAIVILLSSMSVLALLIIPYTLFGVTSFIITLPLAWVGWQIIQGMLAVSIEQIIKAIEEDGK